MSVGLFGVPYPNPSPKLGGGAQGRGLYLTPLGPPVDGGKIAG